MCDFCNGKIKIDTTIGDHDLKISLDEENKRIMNVRLEKGSVGMTRPIVIYFCPICGENLKNNKQ